jgi:hypothetical protein
MHYELRFFMFCFRNIILHSSRVIVCNHCYLWVFVKITVFAGMLMPMANVSVANKTLINPSPNKISTISFNIVIHRDVLQSLVLIREVELLRYRGQSQRCRKKMARKELKL